MNGDTKKILICDDSRDFLTSLKIILTEEGYEVFALHDPTKIMDSIKTEKPDIILLDLVMPNLSGDEIIKKVKKDKKLKKIPIILISASSSVKKIAKETKADDYMEKPISFTKLEEKIGAFLE